jgi:hypothetical protein
LPARWYKAAAAMLGPTATRAAGFLTLACVVGCSDVGDSSALPGPTSPNSDSASEFDVFAGDDGTDSTVEGGSASPDDVLVAATDGSDAASTRSEPDLSDGPSGTEMTPATVGGSLESGATDVASADGSVDSTVQDANADSLVPDAKADATAAADGESRDSESIDGQGTDSGIDATGPSPCTTSPCAASGPNSVECDGNMGMNAPTGVCTPTEVRLVDRDIRNGNLTAAGQLKPYILSTKTGSCYECMVFNDCIDNDVNGDTGKECADVTVATLDTEPGPQECLDTFDCIESNMCDTANPPASCFCGTASGASCLTAGAANGPCLNLEIDGLAVGTCSTTYPAAKSCTEGDATATSKAYDDQTRPAGNANSLLGCAFANCKELCTP